MEAIIATCASHAELDLLYSQPASKAHTYRQGYLKYNNNKKYGSFAHAPTNAVWNRCMQIKFVPLTLSLLLHPANPSASFCYLASLVRDNQITHFIVRIVIENENAPKKVLQSRRERSKTKPFHPALELAVSLTRKSEMSLSKDYTIVRHTYTLPNTPFFPLPHDVAGESANDSDSHVTQRLLPLAR